MKYQYEIRSNSDHQMYITVINHFSRLEVFSYTYSKEDAAAAEYLAYRLAQVAESYDADLDHLAECVVELSDISQLIDDIKEHFVPFPRPYRFTAESVDRLVKEILPASPNDLVDCAVKVALDALLPSWKQALDEGSTINDLVGDIDQLVSELRTFRNLCSEKSTDHLALSYEDREHLRCKAIDEAVNSFDFDGLQFERNGKTINDGPDHYIRTVFAENQEFQKKINVHVIFEKGSFKLLEVYGLCADTGNFVGRAA